MQRGFGGTALEPLEQRRDKEITLGPAMLATLGLGLFALCSLCFVFGYAVGHRGPGDQNPANAQIAGDTRPPATTTATLGKPSAGQNGLLPPQQKTDATPTPIADTDGAAPVDSSDSGIVAPVAEAANSAAGAPKGADTPVRTALPSQPATPSAVPSTGRVESALAQGSSIMVQIAAVSHPEDAEVLVSALRKRGYAVSSRRDPADGLLHVQVGPFANRSDATVMRQKLLNDGYNAIIQ